MDSSDERTGGRDAGPAGAASALPPLEAIPTRVGQSGSNLRSPDELERTSLPSRYLLGEKLGVGGMGVVVEAFDPRMRREIAIKRPLPGRDDGGRILAEARVQSALEHPSIVPVYEVGRDQDGRAYFTMRRLEGVTLADVLRRPDASHDALAPRWSRNRLLRAYVDVCMAVEYAHSRGYVHCDLKPGNVLFGEFGEVYVLDWGTARRYRAGAEPEIEPVSRARTAEGTPIYMAPEQFRTSEPLSPAADVFALGAMLFEILVGEPLHARATSAMQIEAEYARGQLRASPIARAPGRDLSPELDWLCEAALRVDAGERIASARQLADGVQAYLDGDRDLERRRTIASQHLREAEELLESYETEPHPSMRAAAFTEAARALSYDPSHERARDLVTRLLFETPEELPDEVIREVGRQERAIVREQAEVLVAAYAAMLGFLPLFLVGGVRNVPVLLAILLVTGLLLANALLLRRRPEQSTARVVLRALGDAALIGLLASVFGPIALPPAIAVMAALVRVGTPSSDTSWIVPLCHVAAPVVPLALECLGVTHLLDVTADTIVIHASLAPFHPTFTWLALLLYPPTLLAIASYVRARTLRAARAGALRHELQRWHLRQIVGIDAERAHALGDGGPPPIDP